MKEIIEDLYNLWYPQLVYEYESRRYVKRMQESLGYDFHLTSTGKGIRCTPIDGFTVDIGIFGTFYDTVYRVNIGEFLTWIRNRHLDIFKDIVTNLDTVDISTVSNELTKTISEDSKITNERMQTYNRITKLCIKGRELHEQKNQTENE